MKQYAVIRAMMVALFLVAGCKQDIDEAGSGDPQAAVDAVLEQLSQVQQEQGAGGMLEKGRAVLPTLDEPAQQEAVLRWMVQAALEADAYDAVLDVTQALVAENQEQALFVVRVAGPVMRKQRPEPWVTLLLEETAPAPLRAHGLLAWIATYAREAELAQLEETVDAILVEEMRPYATYLVRALVDAALQLEDATRSAKILALLEARTDAAALVRAVRMGQVRLFLRQQDAPAAFAHMQAHRDELGDQALAGLLRNLLPLVQATALQASIESWVYADEQQAFPTLRRRYALWQMHQLEGTQDITGLLQVVEQALQADVPVAILANRLLARHFYALMQTADAEGQRQLQALVQRLRASVGEDAPVRLQASLAMALLDSFYYLEDFAQALALVEAGVPDQDEVWHEELHEKIAAHLALQEGRFADAVELFQRHIERARQWTEPVMAPDSGRQVVADEVIALNERRIGDILLKMDGQDAAAAAAYVRAAQHYQAALAQYADDPAARESVLSELQQLPAEATATGSGDGAADR